MGVFHRPDLSVSSLKESAFLWEHTYIYLGHLDTLKDKGAINPIIKLFENDVLKIVDDPENLKRTFQSNYKYAAMFNRSLLDYLLDNLERICVNPELPENHKKLIEETSIIDGKDKKLKGIIDKEWIDAQTYELIEADKKGELRVPLDHPIGRNVLEEFQTKLITARDISQKNRPHNFHWDNEMLLNQLSVSSSIYIQPWERPYFEYKLNRFSEKDAAKSITGLKAITPFMKKNQINDFSFDEIIEIRKKRTWKGATKELSDLCNQIKFKPDTEEFEELIKNKIVDEFLDIIDEKRISIGGVGKELMKSSVYNSISFIPFVGPIVSTAVGYMDSVVRYLHETKSQKNLPVFISDVRKNN